MPDASTALVSLLRAATGVTALVADRIDDSMIAPRTALPYLVHQLVDAGRTYSNDGPTGLKRATVQVTCYAATYPAAKSLAAAVAAAVDGYTGTTTVGTAVRAIFIDDERDAPAPPAEGQSRGVPGVLLIFIITYGG